MVISLSQQGMIPRSTFLNITDFVSLSRQRYITIDADASNKPSPLTVRDFNAYNIARHIHEFGQQPEPPALPTTGPLPPKAGRRLVTVPSILRPSNLFSESYRSQLPYLETVSATKHDYDAVLMDEDRILGLRVWNQNLVLQEYTNVMAVRQYEIRSRTSHMWTFYI